jgi:hypothetical protein
MLLRLIYKADLSEQQKDAVKQIFSDSRTTLQPLRSQLQAAREALTEDLLAKAADLQLQQDLQNVNNAQAAIAKARLDIIVAVLNLLTPDQLSKVTELRTQLNALHNQARSLLRGSDQP